jgi:hypothetical protein
MADGRQRGRRASLPFPPHIPSPLVLAQRDKSAVPKVGILCPLDKLKLPYERRFEPTAFLHLGRG